MQTQPIKSKSGGITSVIAGGDFMDGAAGALIGYLTNHAMHDLSTPTINLKYNIDGTSNANGVNSDVKNELRIAKKIFAKNGYRLTTEKVTGFEGIELGKNEAFLNFIDASSAAGFFAGNSPNNLIDHLNKYVNFDIKDVYSRGFNIPHETWHQIYNKAQFYYNKMLIHENTGNHDNSTPNLNKGASNQSYYILDYQKNIVNYYLNDKWAK